MERKSMNLFSLLKKYWMTLLLNAVILYSCFMKAPEMPPEVPLMPNFDKVVHFLMFFALSVTVFFDNTRHLKKTISLRRMILGSFLFPVLLGGLIEIGQNYFSSICVSINRSGDWFDFLFDGIGAFAGLSVGLIFNRYISKKCLMPGFEMSGRK